ncbi:hypothetical protein HanXRQr2_Chr07g0280941 [Helianthus annuus]|uniref:Uncharacterized protein n=1 Tax=Helianthus annuus TaxID=4232 RepID=A0A9K3IJ60_HELAN|nr:hypothetical protein HanXRQr2_Chr07g0280941 [Helianthus annuus]
MVRTKERAGASSSSKGKGKQPEEQLKKKRYLGRDDDSESDEEEMIELDPADKPRWEAGPLDEQPEEWKPTLFHDRMNRLKNKVVVFICEREVREVEFSPSHVRLNSSVIILVLIVRSWYDRPSQMKLTVTVNGIKVEMSFDTLRKLAKFDSLPARDYTIPSLDDLLIKPEAHPRWNDMLAALFLPGDKQEVRYPEIPVIYSLLHGSPRFPIRYLIMNHLWICRKKVGRSIILYCRIITGLMKQFKAITSEDRGQQKGTSHLTYKGWVLDGPTISRKDITSSSRKVKDGEL